MLFLALPAVESAAVTYPKPVGYVNDFAGVMDRAAAAQLESFLREFKKRTVRRDRRE